MVQLFDEVTVVVEVKRWKLGERKKKEMGSHGI